MTTPRINFAPGDIIKSAEFNNNFQQIYNKAIIIPYAVQIGNLSGATTYTIDSTHPDGTLGPAAMNALDALAPLGTTFPPVSDVLVVGDIVDLTSGVGPGSSALLDADTDSIIYGTITAFTRDPITGRLSSISLTFSHPVTASDVYFLFPAHTVFYALPADFLRREFVTSMTPVQGIVPFLLPPQTSDPATAALPAGTTWFNTTDKQFKGWNGTSIVLLG